MQTFYSSASEEAMRCVYDSLNECDRRLYDAGLSNSRRTAAGIEDGIAAYLQSRIDAENARDRGWK